MCAATENLFHIDVLFGGAHKNESFRMCDRKQQEYIFKQFFYFCKCIFYNNLFRIVYVLSISSDNKIKFNVNLLLFLFLNFLRVKRNSSAYTIYCISCFLLFFLFVLTTFLLFVLNVNTFNQ